MEFSKLVYRSWAMHLVLRSVKERLLVRIQVAIKAVEECSFAITYVSNMLKSITMDHVWMQGQSPHAEDLHWEFQLQQDRSTILSYTAATTTQVPLPEQLDQQLHCSPLVRQREELHHQNDWNDKTTRIAFMPS